MLGANGAGKSSLLKALMGLEPAAGGSVMLDGADITRWPPSRRVREQPRAGAGGPPHRDEPDRARKSADGRLRAQGHARSDAEIAEIYERFPNLAARRHLLASVLSGGEQQMLAIGRGLLANPKLMMLDEPSLGLSPRLTNEVFALIARAQPLARSCDPAGRAEYSQGAGARQSRLCAGAWPQGHGGRASRAARRSIAARRLSRARGAAQDSCRIILLNH